MTKFKLAQTIKQEPELARFRLAKCVSIQDDRTITVELAADGTQVSGINYASSCVPCPDKGVWVVTDGSDMYALHTISADDLTLAPRAYRDSDQNITDSTDTTVTFQGVNSDLWSCWSVSDATKLTAPITGRFIATGFVRFAGNATGFRSGWILKNGSSTLARVNAISAASGSPTQFTVTTPAFDLTKGEYIELYVRQNSTTTLALTRDGNNTPALDLVYLGP